MGTIYVGIGPGAGGRLVKGELARVRSGGGGREKNITGFRQTWKDSWVLGSRFCPAWNDCGFPSFFFFFLKLGFWPSHYLNI